MSLFVLDCSITMAWCFEDENNDYSDKVLDSLNDSDCVVPPLWVLEVANVLLVAERRNRLNEAGSQRFIELLKDLPIRVEEGISLPECGSILSFGREYTLSAYDARYLELAMRRGLPLATCDKALRMACDKSGVELFMPDV